MAGRKYKPALFELVEKGPLKPDKKGSLRAPKWFYSRNGAKQQSLRKEPTIAPAGPKEFPVKTEQEPELRSSQEPETLAEEGIFGLRLIDKKLVVWAHYMVIGLFILGLILCLVVAFWLGQTSMASGMVRPQASPSDKPTLDQLREGPVLESVLDIPRMTDHVLAATGQITLPQAGAAEETAATSGVSKFCLIVCSAAGARDLRPVQEHFSKKGILTRIGRFEGRYVLYCQEGTDTVQSQQSIEFRRRMVELGEKYPSEKPKGAVNFLPETFRSSYWALRKNITPIE